MKTITFYQKKKERSSVYKKNIIEKDGPKIELISIKVKEQQLDVNASHTKNRKNTEHAIAAEQQGQTSSQKINKMNKERRRHKYSCFNKNTGQSLIENPLQDGRKQKSSKKQGKTI